MCLEEEHIALSLFADYGETSSPTARDGGRYSWLSGVGIRPLLKMHLSLSVNEQSENHDSIYSIQYVGLKCVKFSFLFELF